MNNDNTNTNNGTAGETILNEDEARIETPNSLQRLYALSDAERFPADDGTTEERPSTLFYPDFKVAEAFGMRAVRQTFRGCGNLRTRDFKELVELVAVLNHLGWEAFERRLNMLSCYYFEKFEEADAIARERTEGDAEAARHYFEVLD